MRIHGTRPEQQASLGGGALSPSTASSSAQLQLTVWLTWQDGDVLGAVTFLTDSGDTHITLDKIKVGRGSDMA